MDASVLTNVSQQVATNAATVRAAAASPRAAYIHVPFCRHRCGYCNFTLVAGRDDLVDSYLQAIERELQQLPAPQPQMIDTLYFGGGTPTHLSPEQLRRLSATVLGTYRLADGYEWTVEANPADIDEAMITTLVSLGVTRLSLGGQSFRDDKLRLLERDHHAADIVRAMTMARGAGLHVSLDLIFAAPGETLEQWTDDVEAAIALSPDHVSTYGLTFEQGTSFWGRRMQKQLTEVDEELQRDMYALVIDRLVSAGFEHYEVSNFAQPGRRSRHNQTYWSGDGYYAAGPGAARYVNDIREMNHRSTTTYIRKLHAGESAVAEREQLDAESRAHKLLVFGLRRMEGVSRRDFAVRSGYEIEQLAGSALKKLVDLELLQDNGDRVQLTRAGLFVSDAIWPEML